MSPPTQVTVGAEKVSVTVYRKTRDDLLVSQLSLERWFPSSREANTAVRKTIDALLSVPNHNHEESSS